MTKEIALQLMRRYQTKGRTMCRPTSDVVHSNGKLFQLIDASVQFADQMMENMLFVAGRELPVMQLANVVSQRLDVVVRDRQLDEDVQELLQAFGAILGHGQIVGEILKELGDQSTVHHLEGRDITLGDDLADITQGLSVVLADLQQIHRTAEPMDDLQGDVRGGRGVREVHLPEVSSLNLNPVPEFRLLLRRGHHERGRSRSTGGVGVRRRNVDRWTRIVTRRIEGRGRTKECRGRAPGGSRTGVIGIQGARGERSTGSSAHRWSGRAFVEHRARGDLQAGGIRQAGALRASFHAGGSGMRLRVGVVTTRMLTLRRFSRRGRTDVQMGQVQLTATAARQGEIRAGGDTEANENLHLMHHAFAIEVDREDLREFPHQSLRHLQSTDDDLVVRRGQHRGDVRGDGLLFENLLEQVRGRIVDHPEQGLETPVFHGGTCGGVVHFVEHGEERLNEGVVQLRVVFHHLRSSIGRRVRRVFVRRCFAGLGGDDPFDETRLIALLVDLLQLLQVDQVGTTGDDQLHFFFVLLPGVFNGPRVGQGVRTQVTLIVLPMPEDMTSGMTLVRSVSPVELIDLEQRLVAGQAGHHLSDQRDDLVEFLRRARDQLDRLTHWHGHRRRRG